MELRWGLVAHASKGVFLYVIAAVLIIGALDYEKGLITVELHGLGVAQRAVVVLFVRGLDFVADIAGVLSLPVGRIIRIIDVASRLVGSCRRSAHACEKETEGDYCYRLHAPCP